MHAAAVLPHTAFAVCMRCEGQWKSSKVRIPVSAPLPHYEFVRAGTYLHQIGIRLLTEFHLAFVLRHLALASKRQQDLGSCIGWDRHLERKRPGAVPVLPVTHNFSVHGFVFAASFRDTRVQAWTDHNLTISRS